MLCSVLLLGRSAMSANRVSQSRSGLNGGAAERPVSTCMRTLSANAHAARRCNVLLRSSIFELCAPNPFSCSAALRFFHHFLHPLLYRYSRALTFVLPSLFRTRPDLLLLLPLLFLLLLLLPTFGDFHPIAAGRIQSLLPPYENERFRRCLLQFLLFS